MVFNAALIPPSAMLDCTRADGISEIRRQGTFSSARWMAADSPAAPEPMMTTLSIIVSVCPVG